MKKEGEEGDNGGNSEGGDTASSEVARTLSQETSEKTQTTTTTVENAPPPTFSKIPAKRVVAGRYHPGKELGKGAYSKVYSAVDSITGSQVAIKKVETGYLSARDLERIRQELCLLKRLIHPNIVSLIDFEETNKTFNFVLEFIEGGSLHEIKTKFGNIPEPLLSFYMSQTLKGLHHLHSFNIVHRDIKGANILVTKLGECKLADFGSCSEALREDNKMTMIGTPYWMAPELISQTGGGCASDIWSLGCTILELFTGQPPYWKLNSNLALLRMVEDPHPPLPEAGTASPLLIQFLQNCFLKDYKMRYTAQELQQHDWITRYALFGLKTPRNFTAKIRSRTPPPTSAPRTPKKTKKGLGGFGKKKDKSRVSPMEFNPVDEGGSEHGGGEEDSGTGSSGNASKQPKLSIATSSGSNSSNSIVSPRSGGEGSLPMTPSSPASLPSSSKNLLFEKKDSDPSDGEDPTKLELKAGSEPSKLLLPRIESELTSEIATLKEDIDEWEKKLYELLQERAELENQNDELRVETEMLLKKKDTLEAKRDYLKDLIARREKPEVGDLLEVDFSSIIDRLHKELGLTQREVEMTHTPKTASVCWMGPGAICQCRDSGTHKWDAAVITGTEVSGMDLLFHVIFLRTGEKDQVRASDIQPLPGHEDGKSKKKPTSLFSAGSKKEKRDSKRMKGGK